MLKRASPLFIQTRGVIAIKSNLKITWKKPEYVPSYKPEKSGDLEAAPKIPDDAIAAPFQHCDELENASEVVKKLFSASFVGGGEQANLARISLQDRVKRHQYDCASAESYIALLTGRIRWLQNHMEKFPRDVKNKQLLQELIDKRKQRLKFLRMYDYRKFEWILEQLNIVYKGYPESPHRLSRKESLRKLTEMHCENLRNSKLEEYRNLLESQQGPFLREKLEALQTIKREQVELKLEVTVTDKDIELVRKALEEWTAKDEVKKKLLAGKRRNN